MLGFANGHALPDLAGQERRRIHMGSPTMSTWIRRVHWVLFTASAIGRQCLDLWRLSLAGTSRRLLALVTEAMRSSFRVATNNPRSVYVGFRVARTLDRWMDALRTRATIPGVVGHTYRRAVGFCQ